MKKKKKGPNNKVKWNSKMNEHIYLFIFFNHQLINLHMRMICLNLLTGQFGYFLCQNHGNCSFLMILG